MKRIVYVMQVDWKWIKQRPHFLAEELAKDQELVVMYQHRYSRSGHQNRSGGGLQLRPVFVIPRGDRYPFLRAVNRKIKNAAIRTQVKKKKTDCLYLTFPDQVEAIPKNFTGKVIYDCMDNHPAFLQDPAARQVLQAQEAELVSRATHVLVSSQKLGQVLLERYGQQYGDKLVLVRNGYSGEILDVQPTANSLQETYIVAYFGTISSWFDFDCLCKSLEDFPNLQYLLMGPADAPIPQHERIRYIGTVEHKDLQNVTRDAQCLMMPFTVNEIIESVDPVKLYEYINFNKDILCVKYPEVERFAPYVHFYTDYASFREQLMQLMQRTEVKYTEQEREAFLLQNSWKERADTIRSLL